jgi:hypothetical protein
MTFGLKILIRQQIKGQQRGGRTYKKIAAAASSFASAAPISASAALASAASAVPISASAAASAASAVPISASAASASAAFPPPSQSAASAKPEFTYKDRRAIICKKNSGWVYFRFDDGSEGHSYGKYLRIYSCTQMILCMVLKFIRGGEESHTIVNSFVYKLL